MGTRSMTGQLPQFSYTAHPHATVISESNNIGSTVFVMIETALALQNLDSIASVDGVDVLLVGSNDLSIELGCPAEFESPVLKEALEKVSQACKKHGKIMALAGIYDKPEIQRWAVRELGVGWMLGGQDASFIAKGAVGCVEALKELEKE
jgi:2-keto-3-deoxy-L-rhamnonate aldolase RhmA